MFDRNVFYIFFPSRFLRVSSAANLSLEPDSGRNFIFSRLAFYFPVQLYIVYSIILTESSKIKSDFKSRQCSGRLPPNWNLRRLFFWLLVEFYVVGFVNVVLCRTSLLPWLEFATIFLLAFGWNLCCWHFECGFMSSFIVILRSDWIFAKDKLFRVFGILFFVY